MEQLNEYEFTPLEAALLAEYELGIRDLNSQRAGTIKVIMRQHGLVDGKWNLVGNKLVKQG